MTQTTDNGGYAFPSEQGQCPDGSWNQSYEPGMSLRDYFAAHAPDMPDWWMPGDIPAPPPGWSEGDGPEKWEAAVVRWSLNRLALWRWHYADAMLAARKGGAS